MLEREWLFFKMSGEIIAVPYPYLEIFNAFLHLGNDLVIGFRETFGPSILIPYLFFFSGNTNVDG